MIYLKMLGAMLCAVTVSLALDMSIISQLALHIGILLIVLTGDGNNA
tara:strand:+ start:676 stop:816 length:141 start_codon:yes stop_codon:yes gene_type:complete